MEYFAIAKVVKPQGIRGEVKLETYVEDPQRFSTLPHIYTEQGGAYVKHEVTSGRLYRGFAYLKLADYPDRNAAETLRGQYLYIDRAHAAELPEGANYIADLLGLRVEDDEGHVLGRLEDVLQNGGVDVYQVSDGERTVLFPLAPGVELERDLENGVIRVSAARLKEVAVHV